MRSSFWRVIFGILVALAAPIVLSLVVAVLVLSVPPIGRYALSRAITMVGPRFGLDVRFGRIEGNIMRSFTIDDLAVKFGPDSLRAKTVTLTYDPWASIAHRTFSASSAGAVEPVFFVSSVRPVSAQRGTGRSQYPPIRVGQFRISAGSMYLDTVQRLDSVDLVLNLVSEPTQLQAQLSDVRARLRSERISLTKMGGSVRLTPDSLNVTDFVARTLASSLRADLRMAWSPNAIAARVESVSISLPEFTSFPGRFRAAGTVGLDGNQPSGNVEYAAEGLVWQDVHLPTISGSLGLKDSFVQVTMSGSDTALGSAEVSGRLDLRKFDFSGSAHLNGIRVRRLHPSLPEVKVDADAAVSGRGLDSIAADVSARIPDLGIESLTVAGAYTGANRVVAISWFGLSGAVGTISGRGRWRGGRAEAEVSMDQFDLGLLARFDSLPVRGRVSGSISLAGTAETLDAVADLSVAGLDVAGVHATSAHTTLRAAVGRGLSGRVRAAVDGGSYGGIPVDSVRLTWDERQFSVGLWRSGLQAMAEGSARLLRDSIGVDVAALRITAGTQAMTFHDALQLKLRRDSIDVRFVATGLAGGDVRVALAGVAGNPPRVDASVSNLDLARLKALLGLGPEVSGIVNLEATGTDTFSLSLAADNLKIPDADVELARVEGTARVSRTRTEFDHLWLVHQDSAAVPETSAVAGSVEYKTEGGFEVGAADLRVRLRNPGSWVVFYLKSIIALKQGNIYGDLKVRGNLMQPMFDGRVRISRALLGVPVIGTSFDRVNVELVFDRSRINIEKLTGKSDHGNALVTGFVDIGRNWQPDSLRFHGDFSGTTINPMPEIYGTIGGSLDLNWVMGRPFSLSGTVNVEEALIAFGFGQSTGTGTGASDTLLVYDVRVKGDRNIWFRNQLADIELACDLTVRKTTTDVLYSGELTSRQGSVYYLDHTLRVDSGSVHFDNINTLNPEFYIAAEMPIRATVGEPGTPDTIALTLTGTLEHPNLVFRAAPPIWDETEILTYLALNVTPDQITAPEMKGNVTKLLGQRLLGYFQNQASKRARGFVNLDYLEFESSLLDSNKQARVTVGKYVGKNLYVSYTQNVGGVMIPSFRVEYYINRKNEILAEGSAQGAAGAQYRTSLRYRFRLRY
jgi:autotransporter translocation and assembly factor TamB